MKLIMSRILIACFVMSTALALDACGPTPPTPTAPAELTPVAATETLPTPPLPQVSPRATIQATQAPRSPTATTAALAETPQATSEPTPPVVLPPPVTPLTQTLTDPITGDTAASVVEVARLGGGPVSELAYSPDGQQVALVTSLGLELHDTETLAELPFLEPDPGWSLATFSPDWQTVAWKLEHQIRLQRTSDGQVLRTLEGGQGRAGRVAFSPDGSLLADLRFLPGEEVDIGYVELWRVSDGTLLGTWDAEGSDLAWSPDGKLLATWFAMSGVSIWSVPDGTRVHQIEGGAVDAAFSPDGQSLALAGFGSGMQFWRVSDWTQLWQFEAWPSHCRFSPDGTLLAFAQTGGPAMLLRVADGELVREVGYGLADSASPLAFSPDGRVLALGSSMDVQFWGVTDGSLLQVLEGHSYGVASTAVSSDGRTVAFLTRSPCSPGAAVRLWEVSGASAPPLANSGDALSFAWSPGGKTVALGTWEFQVQLVQVPSGQVIRTLGPLSAQVQSVAFSPQGDLVAASAMGEVDLWRVTDGTRLQTWHLPDGGWLDGVTFSPGGTLLAAQAANPLGTIWVWDVETGNTVLTLAEPETEYTDNLAFLPDGRALAVEKPGVIELWSVPDGVLLDTLEVAADAGPFAFSPDGTLLALSAGEVIQLWGVSEGELLATLVGHSGWVGSVVFSPDGRFLVTGSEDGTVRLWGVVADSP
jgi:WD40 repeat protein